MKPRKHISLEIKVNNGEIENVKIRKKERKKERKKKRKQKKNN